MATHRIPLGEQMMPDASGNVFQQPYPISATNDFWKHGVWVFLDTATDDYLHGFVEVPQNYVGTAAIKFIWTSTATSGNVVWEFAYRTVAGDDAASLDQATAEETVSVTDAAPTATDRRLEASVNLTAANLAAGETLQFKIGRKGTSGSDTMAASAYLLGVYLSYADA